MDSREITAMKHLITLILIFLATTVLAGHIQQTAFYGRTLVQWTPSVLGTKVSAWYDFSDSTTVTLTNSYISSITDLSGNGNSLTQSVYANMWIYSNVAINGKAALWSPKSSDGRGLKRSTTIKNFATNTLAIYFIATLTNNTTTSPTAFALVGGDGLNWDTLDGCLVSIPNGSSSTNAYVYRHNNSLSSMPCPAINKFFVWGSVFDGSNETTRVNGVAGTPVSTSTSRFNPIEIDIGWTGSGGWVGFIGEMIITPDVSSATIQHIETYLKWKYSL